MNLTVNSIAYLRTLPITNYVVADVQVGVWDDTRIAANNMKIIRRGIEKYLKNKGFSFMDYYFVNEDRIRGTNTRSGWGVVMCKVVFYDEFAAKSMLIMDKLNS